MQNSVTDSSFTPNKRVETAVPVFAEPYIVEKGETELDNCTYTYLVLGKDIQSKLHTPSIFATGKDFLSVSENYPEKWRALGVKHEIKCTCTTGEYGCQHTLEWELEELKNTELDYTEYIIFRKSFFKELVDYYENKDRNQEEHELLIRLKHSLDFLNQISVNNSRY